jgi:hypothetical protein
MTDDKKDPAELQVRDRRRFNTDGSIRDGSEDASEPVVVQESSAPSPQKKSEPPQEPEPPKRPKSSDFEVNFSAFILSLASSVQVALGLAPHPATGRPMPNLNAARQTIDVLSMLAEKTKGNLDPEEDGLLKQILHELKMHYVTLIEEYKKNPPAKPGRPS